MLGLVYSVVSYLAFLAVFVYFALFANGILVPKSVDSGSATELGLALAINVGLLLLWGLQHSAMARPGFKAWLTRVVPAHLERATYVMFSNLALGLLIWQWQPLHLELWHVESQAVAAPLWTINALGWLGVPACSFMIDHFNLFGLKQAWMAFRRQTVRQQSGFVTPLLYKYVRHPMMTSILVGLWVTPHMTAGHLMLSLGMSVYIMIGVHFEERALLRELGQAYRLYQAATPQFLPVGGPKPELSDSTSR
jgi:protein-S-isoprenylcysteine O-methyltransferase Ste14